MVVSMVFSEPDVDNESYATAADEQPEELALKEAQMTEMGVSINDVANSKNSSEGALKLPESTHSFLFTEPVCSIPFLFSLGIAAISYGCLALALVYNVKHGCIPTNVVSSVRVAQYLSILIALLMEEEIPTGLYLLRRISQPYLKSKFPNVSYPKFVMSSVLRITMGYLFLVNVVIVLVQADGVIEIFYDVLALQFLQRLDDIGFSVSKMEVLGERLERATLAPSFHVDFQKEKESLGLKWRIRFFLKAVYFLNLAGFLSAMIVVSAKQISGEYQCDSITIRFGDEVWQDAIVQWPSHSNQYPPGLTKEMVLAYSYFDGVYVKDPSRSNGGRPIYIEQKKSNRAAFDETTPVYDPYHPGNSSIDRIMPAEIKYCGGHWMFSHDYIRKSRKDKVNLCFLVPMSTGAEHYLTCFLPCFSHRKSEECNWLARSPETEGFDLFDVDGKWQIWTGVIVETEVSVKCNECSDDYDCNLNGICNRHGKCDCDIDENAVYLGTHCEVKLEDKCRTITGEKYNDTWSVGHTGTFSADASIWVWTEKNEIFQEYSRPVYSYQHGLPEGQAPEEGDSFSLIYSGNKWFMINLQGAQDETANEFWAWQTSNYHVTNLVSEPTYKDSPVGVDFYYVGERGSQFGPFGALYPVQKHNTTGVSKDVVPAQNNALECCKSSGISIISSAPQSVAFTVVKKRFVPSATRESPPTRILSSLTSLMCLKLLVTRVDSYLTMLQDILRDLPFAMN
ncbi:hypothetical protein ACHAXR_006358 [Thalassiosira sp. AJA248-18]